jgi:predicted Zn finger-like uncharacterized protein
MLIVCPHCATSYEIKTGALGDEGRSVRCVRCQTVWFAAAREVALEAAGAPGAMAKTITGPEPDAAMADEGEFYAEASEQAAVADFSAEADPAVEDQANLDPAMVETIDGAPPLAPGQDTEHQTGHQDEHQSHEPPFAPGEGPFPITGGDIDAFRRRKASKRAQHKRNFTLPKFTWPLAPLPTLLLGLGATVAILIGWRTDAVRLLPQTASLYSAIGLGVNLRGLVFENIKTSREIHEGVPVVVVEGEIVSITRKAVEVPRLRFGVRNGLGAEIYNWTAMPSRAVAQAGERLTFRSRLASPPAEMHDISVRFYNRRDAMAGLR